MELYLAKVLPPATPQAFLEWGQARVQEAEGLALAQEAVEE